MTTTIAEMDERIADLQKKFDAQEQDQIRIDAKRKQVALPALADNDPKAQRELDRLNREKSQKVLEKENVRFAITAAEQKKQEILAQQREEKAAKDKAELLKIAKQRVEINQEIDNALQHLFQLLSKQQEIAKDMSRYMGDPGWMLRTSMNRVIRKHNLHHFFEVPVWAGTSAHEKTFQDYDQSNMGRKGIAFSKAGNPTDFKPRQR